MESGTKGMDTCQMESLPDEVQKLIQYSNEMKNLAYCPYSHFRVGSAILTKDGHVFKGCNVENASYSLGVCAERCAIFKAVSEGFKEFTAIAVASDVRDYHIGPCGACRQVIYEFARDADLYLTKPDGSVVKTTASKLMPYGFGPECLNFAKIDIANGNGTS